MNCRAFYRTILVFVLALAFGRFLRAAPIHDAAGIGDVEKVRDLLATDPTLVDGKTSDGVTPLLLAAQNGRLEVVRLLLEKGAAVDARSNEGATPLIHAATKGRLEVVRLLLEKGAAVNAKGNDGLTPLIAAARKGHLEVVRLLLEKDAAVDAKDSNGLTPLMVAARDRNLEMVKLLLEKGAAVDAKDNKSVTPVMAAAENGHIEVVSLLLEKGAPVDAKDNNGVTSLMIAAQNWNPVVEKQLRTKSATSADLEPLARPTVIFSGENEGRLPVMGVSGKKPQIMVDGKMRKLGFAAVFTFARAKDFAPGKVEIKNVAIEYSYYRFTDIPGGRTLGQGESGVYISADIIPALSYDDCYCVLVLFSGQPLIGVAEDAHKTVLFKSLGHLAAGQKKEIVVDVDGDQVPRFPRPLFLVFSKGVEIESDEEPMIARFLREEELRAHRRRLAACFLENRNGDSPLRNYLAIEPVLAQGISLNTLPATINADCTISVDGVVEDIELPNDLPAPTAREILRAVSEWLFLPRMQKGIPQRATIQIPIALRDEATAGAIRSDR